MCKEGKLDKYDRAEDLEDKESADPGTEPPEHYLPLVRIVIRVQLLYPAIMLPRRRANQAVSCKAPNERNVRRTGSGEEQEPKGAKQDP